MRVAITMAFIAAAMNFLSGCKADAPPVITLCMGDGLGGADCRLPDGTKVYWTPSELENAWITTQADAARLLSWCYGGKVKNPAKMVEQYKMERFAE